MNVKLDQDIFLEKYNSCKTFNEEVTVDHFELAEKIGQGAFAGVYKSILIKPISAEVPDITAIKIVDKHKLEKLDVSEIVCHEIKLLASLLNPFIIGYYTSFSCINNVYIVLEWMPFDLFPILRSKLYFGEETTRFIGSQVLLGLEYLHSFSIAYRDLKPENILIGFNRGIKITDFSFSKYIPGRSYTTNGTVEYMAPEIVLSSGHGLAVDVWAFAVLLYELAAGHSPFKAHSTLNIMRNISKAKYKFPDHFSYELKDLIQKMLVVDVSKRLGCMKNGKNDIKEHSWFYGDVDWTHLEQQHFDIPRELLDLSDIDRKIF